MQWSCALVLMLALAARGAEPSRFLLPEGFTIGRVDAHATRFPMFATLDPAGRLYVAESSGLDLYAELSAQTRRCRVSVLEDLDQDGVFEAGRVYVDALVFPMGLAWRDGALYVADPPDLAVYRDRDGDGRAESRQVILTGFGHKDNGSLHGLTFGPDGWLYMTMGAPDGYRLRRADGTYLEGNSGALIRCRPDGTDPEVICRGFENLIEVVWLPDGSIIGTDNWFQRPEDGLRDALVHLVPGGLYPLNLRDHGTEFIRTGIALPPIHLVPAVAYSGLCRYEGRKFPAEMHGSLFAAEHNSRKVTRHQLTPRGASYASRSFEFLSADDPDFHPADVLEAPDGSLLVVDTGAWYVQHCPTGRIRQSQARGGIYRVKFGGPGAPASPENAPQRLEERTPPRAALPGDQLAALLARGDEAARRDAAFALAAQSRSARSSRANSPEPAAPGTTEALWQALAGVHDLFLEHALVYALWHLTNERELRQHLGSANPRLLGAALVLAEQKAPGLLGAELVLPHLASADERLRAAVFQLLERHPDWIGPAGQALGEQLGRAESAAAFDSILGQFHGVPAVQQATLELLRSDSIAPDRKVWAIDSLARTSTSASQAEAFQAVLGQLMRNGPAPVRAAAVTLAASSGAAGFSQVLTTVAGDARESDAIRLVALGGLARELAWTEARWNLLRRVLAESTDATLKFRAVELLGRMRGSEASFEGLAHLADTLEPAYLNLLLPVLLPKGGLPPALSGLWPILEKRVAGGWSPSPAEIERLVKPWPPAGQARAASLLRLLAERQQDQWRRLEAHLPLAFGGNPARGRDIFFGPAAACSSCHRVAGEGGQTGPDLSQIGGIRSGRDLLESILFPSSTLAQGYQAFGVVLRDGREFDGTLVEQGAGHVLFRNAAGQFARAAREDILDQRPRALSLMPEGLEAGLSPEQLRDLLAYLQSLKSEGAGRPQD